MHSHMAQCLGTNSGKPHPPSQQCCYDWNHVDIAQHAKVGSHSFYHYPTMPIRLTPKNTMGSILAWSNLFQRPCWNSSAYSLMNGRAATTWSKSAGPLVLFAAGAANRVKHTASRIDQWFCGATSASETPPSRREPLCTRLAHRCKYGSGERTLCRRRRLGCRRCSSSASLG